MSFLLIDICFVGDVEKRCLGRNKAEGDWGDGLEDEEKSEREEMNERLEKENLQLVRRSKGGRSGTELTGLLLSKTWKRRYQQHHQHQFHHHDCQSWFTWKSNLSRVLAKRIRRLAEESSPVGRTTCIFHEWSLRMVLRWKKWWMVVIVVIVVGGELVVMCNYLWPTWTSDAHNTHPSLLGIRTFINRCRFCIFSVFFGTNLINRT